MQKLFLLSLAALFAMGMTGPLIAAEHGGKEHGGAATHEHGGQEQDGSTATAPSADDIKAAMKAHVDENTQDGVFSITDPKTGATRHLQLVRIHERVGKTGHYYYSCADFKDVDTGDLLDLDIDVEDQGGVLKVADVRIHKDNGVERYTYDENDNRIPLAAEAEGAPAHEHGGKEHGGN